MPAAAVGQMSLGCSSERPPELRRRQAEHLAELPVKLARMVVPKPISKLCDLLPVLLYQRLYRSHDAMRSAPLAVPKPGVLM